MATSVMPAQVVDTDRQREHYHSLVEHALREARDAGEDRIVGVAVPLAHDWDPLHWLEQRTEMPRVYWRARWSDAEYAAAGSLHTVQMSGGNSLQSALSQIDPILRRIIMADDLPAALTPRFFGGAAFDACTHERDGWERFGDCSLVLPEAVLYRSAEQVYLVVLLPVKPKDSDDDLLTQLGDLLSRYSTTSKVSSAPVPSGHVESTGVPVEQWSTMVNRALKAIQSGRLQKVVLSREIQWRADGIVPAWSLVRLMRAGSEGSYIFAFQPTPDTAFVSTTPERLLRVAEGNVETDCIAGTAPRHANPGKDDELERSLLTSGKDRREHGFVVEGVVEALRSLCTNADVGAEPWVMRLPTVQHLVTTARGQLRPDVSLAEVVTRLHPTPAVGGMPRDAALAEIRSIEPRGRGWYGGPIGWIGLTSAEFAVGIRSGLVCGDRVRLFAGAGIVAGSSPQREWDETELKAESLLKMLQP